MKPFPLLPSKLSLRLAITGLLVAAPLFAKVGEKKEDLVERWGRPLPGFDSTVGTMWVLRNVAYLTIWNDKMVSITESMRRIPPEEKLTEEQIADFLKFQLPAGATWERVPLGPKAPPAIFGGVTLEGDPANEELWRSSDGKRLARVVRAPETSVTIYSEEGAMEEWLRKKMIERPAPAKP